MSIDIIDSAVKPFRLGNTRDRLVLRAGNGAPNTSHRETARVKQEEEADTRIIVRK